VLDALGKPSSSVPFMMPKRVAETDPFKRIDDYSANCLPSVSMARKRILTMAILVTSASNSLI
jgi:hypothetical protein